MDWPLVIPSILRRAGQFFPEKAIVSRWADGTIHRMTYGDLQVRVHRLMNVLRGLGIQPGDRVATLAWNHHRHLELYFAIPSLGAVLHTINFRLSREQLVYIINHARDRVIFADRSVAAILAALQADLPGVKNYVLMDDRCPQVPALPQPSIDYEELMAAASDRVEFPVLEENTAAGLCYTSATTGDPKGVLYSHRSTFLHAMAGCMVDGGAVAEKEVALPAVPMFHVNAWGLPYSATLCGATQVFPGSGVIGQPLAELLEAERVTCASGVPTIWNLLYQHLKEKRYDLSKLHTLLVGGSAASRAMMENYQRDFGIRVLHAWGMTETSPIGTVSRLKAAMEDWPDERQLEVRLKQGIPVPGVEAKLLGDHGEDLPWDGNARRRAGRARALDRQQLLPQPRGRRRVHGRRLVPDRRHGEHRSIWLCPAHRPQEGPYQAEGGVDLQRGHGKCRAGTSRRARSGRRWPDRRGLRRGPRRPRGQAP